MAAALKSHPSRKPAHYAKNARKLTQCTPKTGERNDPDHGAKAHRIAASRHDSTVADSSAMSLSRYI